MIICSFRRLATALGFLAAASVCGGCAAPVAFDSLQGDPIIYPDGFYGKPTVLAFLNANDRLCDLEIKPLAAYHHRGDSPVQVICVMVYDRFEFVKQINTLSDAVFKVVLDPERKLASKYGIRRFPTYLYADTRADELARTYEVGTVRDWMDSKLWHERGYRLPDGALRKASYREAEQGYDPYKAEGAK